MSDEQALPEQQNLNNLQNELSGQTASETSTTPDQNFDHNKLLSGYRKAQALFEHLFESTPDANMLVDEQGLITAVNHQAEIYFGYLREELLGQPIEMLLPEEFRQRHQNHRNRYNQSPRLRPMGVGLELYGLRKNGSKFPVDITLNPLKTDDGLVILCVIKDISVQLANQRALRDQTGIIKLLQEISSAANESKTIEEAFKFALNRLCNYMEWEVGHAVLAERDGLAPSGIWNVQPVRYLDEFQDVSNKLRWTIGEGLPGQVLQTKSPLWLTNLTSRPNFLRREQAIKSGLKTAMALPVMVGHEVVAALEFFATQAVEPDPKLLAVLPHIGYQLGRVIERKRAEDTLRKREAQLQTLVTNLPVILWATDKNGELVVFEGKEAQATKISRGQVVGRTVSEVMKDRPEIAGYVQQALGGKELRIEIPSPSGKVYDTFFVPYYDKGGQVDGVICLALDVTDRKRIEAELDEMQHHLMQSVESERMRLGQQIHDGPLQDLYGVYYQIQEVKNTVGEQDFAIVEHSLQTIQKVNSTLSYILGELRPSTLVHLGLKRAILSNIERVQERVPEMEFHLDLMDDHQLLSHNLRLGLFRVYQYLISNITQHSEAKHTWIRLDLSPEWVTLEVQDNGKGFEMPNSWIELVRKGQFGLAGALERVEAMNGKIDIQTRLGMGTLVRVKVPRSR